ncbi:hypothetical protein OsI_01233 [Oryza sativa Indica Group]|uniref:NB-ARC domain-containing protein n=1 Tax=Oryza sativa subsp. indica TaxID=39946 RepID=A2WN10_ORYSI|nr:hypothetical protein OsI_01233 [Oryza sativa Indica Group]
MEEAEGRRVTSPAMLRQRRQLRWEMCRAAYALDALRIRNAAAAAASRRRRRRCQPLLLSLGGDGDATVMESLEAALGGAKELVVLLAGCPRLSRQPYSAYLFMERCMFGRQMEKEQISQTFTCWQPQAVLSQAQHRRFGIDPSSRSLVVVDVIGDVDEEPWRRLCSSVRRENGDGKVVIICRTAEHAARLGTAPRPVTLDNLHRPELWYMFRVLAFGGADPEDRPELVAIAAELFEGVKHLAMIAAVNTQAVALRADMTARSWRRIARAAIDAHGGRGEHGPVRDEDDSYYLYRPSMDGPHCLFYGRRKLDDVDAGGEHDTDGDDAGPAQRPRGARRGHAALRRAGVAISHTTALQLRSNVRHGKSAAVRRGFWRQEAIREEKAEREFGSW